MNASESMSVFPLVRPLAKFAASGLIRLPVRANQITAAPGISMFRAINL